MRQILHAHREGWVTALDHPQAVVVDYQEQMLRQGTGKMPVRGPKAFRLLALLLRAANIVHARAAIAQAVEGAPCRSDWQITQNIHDIEPYLIWLGMTVETVEGGYRLHTDPRETLECCRTIAPGQPLPPRSKSTQSGRGVQCMMSGSFARSSTHPLAASAPTRRSSPTTRR